MQNKLMNGLVAALMLLTVMAFAVPTATAHTGCAGLTPDQCGQCLDDEEHDHSVSYTGGLVKWCTWKPPAQLIAELLDGTEVPQPDPELRLLDYVDGIELNLSPY